MIKDGYRGSRFAADDVPLLKSAWELTDEIEGSGQARVALEVLAGSHYKRQLVDTSLANTAYMLQLLLHPNLSKNTYREWLRCSLELQGRFIDLREQSGAMLDLVVEPNLGMPSHGGAFGHERHEDSIVKVRQSEVVLSDSTCVRGLTQVRMGVIFPGGSVFHETTPKWNDRSVRQARRGEVVIGDLHA